MDVTLSVLADYANITQDGKLNIMGVFTEVNPPELPFALPMMFLVTIYTASPAEVGSEKALRVTLLDGDGKQLMNLETPITVPKPIRAGSRVQLNSVIGLGGVRFDKAGDYQFSILVGGEEKKSLPLHVNNPENRGA